MPFFGTISSFALKNMPKKLEVTEEVKAEPTQSRKEWLQELYQTLRDLKVNSIGDLENLISRAEE